MWHFYWEWLRLTFSMPYGIAAAIGFGLTFVAGIVIWRRPKWEGKLKNLLWQVPLVIFIGGIIIGAIVAPYNIYKEKQDEVVSLSDSVRFGLAFNTVTVGIGNSSEGVSLVTVGIRLQNTSKELIQYKVINFKVTLGNKTIDNPTFLNTEVYVHPGQSSDYFYPTIEGIDLTKQAFGTLEYEIHYSSVPNKYWYMSRRKLTLDLVTTDLATSQGQVTWRALEEEESPISQP